MMERVVQLWNFTLERVSDADALGFPKRDESESPVQSGGIGCEQEFHYGRILTQKVFGVWPARASEPETPTREK
jgi:hypothetical protein